MTAGFGRKYRRVADLRQQAMLARFPLNRFALRPGFTTASFKGLMTCLVVFLAVLSTAARAQSFQSIPALSFTKTLDSASNPLPQSFTANSVGASFNVASATATTTTGGNWLSVAFPEPCCNRATPLTIDAVVNPDVSLAAGVYNGQIVLTGPSGTTPITIQVSLTIQPATATYFDELPGGYTFAMQTNGTVIAPQALPIRNAGSGPLTWTSSVSTADGGNWLSLSSATGTTPSIPNVQINPANLPNGGRLAGTFIGQVLLKTASGNVSIPVTVNVGPSVLSQIGPLGFNKTAFSSSDPLTQIVTIANTGANTSVTATAVAGTGGSWLSLAFTGGCCGYVSPQALTVTVNPDISLPAGTYTSEILISGGQEIEIVPVTLTIESASATYFDALPGELTFSMQTGGKAPPVQALPIRDGGSGTLSWTASVSTGDGGNWLVLSSSSGTAPSTPNVGIVPANLPNAGMVAGTFTGQIVLRGGGDSITVPVTVTVGDSVFRQNNPLSFTKTVNSASNPLPQVMTIASTGAAIAVNASTVDGTGGSWLSVAYAEGCCTHNTPESLVVSVNPSISLAAGTYTAEIVVQTIGGARQVEIVPVTLTVESTVSSFFDELPGQLTFSMQTSGLAPPSELLQIRNAGAGTLTFNSSVSTADGGNWLLLSATTGTAPYLLSVAINPANLPFGGAVAGTFTGQVVLTTSGDTVTIPVSVTVGANVLRQNNALNFTKTANSSSNPLPQLLTVASTGGGPIAVVATAENGTGGNWLSVAYGEGCCTHNTSEVLTVSVAPDIALAAGTYTAEVIIQAANGSQTEVVPVTLTVAASNTRYFDAFPGALTFSAQATGIAPPPQPLAIRNAAPGLLNWAASASTSDGGKWISMNGSSGVAPAAITVTIVPANLPNQGKVAGTFTGQIMFQAVGDIVTVPVVVTIGDSVFNQPNAINFSKTYQGANPTAQTIQLTSTDAVISLSASGATATGGSWFTLAYGEGCCTHKTPETFTLTATPDPNLLPGVYQSAIYIYSATGGEPSVVPVTLTIMSSVKTADPIFSIPGGTYTSNQTLTLDDTTTNALIHYTTDGSTPTLTSGIYRTPIQITSTQTIKAIAAAPDNAPSNVVTMMYTIASPVADPTTTVVISEATAGATVYYTTNGSTPTTASTVYSGPIPVQSGSILKYIAITASGGKSNIRTITVQ